MVWMFLISISLLLFFILSALCRQSPYEKHLSDTQQEQFIKEYHHKKKSSL